ncbi:MAG: sugar transferase [Patescibacteria group bacterium]|nr:sugar transferase [Patescibacteria group bacterium]
MIFLLVLSDALGIGLAFTASYAARRWGPLSQSLEILLPFSAYQKALPFAVALFLLIAYLRGLYRPHRRLNQLSESYELVKAVTGWALLIMAGSYLSKQDYSRIIVVSTWVLSIGTITIGRLIAGRTIRVLAQRGIGTIRVLVVGSGKPARIVAQELKRYERLGYRIVGCVGEGDCNGVPLLGAIGEAPPLIARHRINQVYVADPSLSYDAILNLVHRCPKSDVEFRVAANIFPRLHEPHALNELEGLPSLDLRKIQPNALHRTVKRLLDLGLGGVMLVVSAPLWLAITYLIRRDSAGPAVIRQTRVGYKGHRFTLYKFRSMSASTDRDGPPPTGEEDPRVTRLGKFLRRTSLDELPQLLNVLKGDMSLVGPRPELVSLAATYRDWQFRRFDAKPGMTGLWQVLGRKDLNLEQKLEYDFYYVNNQSLLLDLVILVRTIPVTLFGRGAY